MTALRQETVGRDTYARRTEHEDIVVRVVRLRQHSLTYNIHIRVGGRKLHRCNLDIYGRVLRGNFRHLHREIQVVDFTCRDEVVDMLSIDHTVVVLLEVDFLSEVVDGTCGFLLHLAGIGQTCVADEVVDAPV